MANPDHGVLKGWPAFINNPAVFVENRPTPCAAIHITFVGSGKMVIVNPSDSIGLPHPARLVFVKDQRTTCIGCVNPCQVNITSGEMVNDPSLCRNHHHVVVFLQGHHNFPQVVDVNKFRLRIFRADGCQTGQVNCFEGAASKAVIDNIHQRQESGWHLPRTPVPQIFVPLVLNGHCNKVAIGGNGIGLATQITDSQFCLAGHIHCFELS